MDRDEDPYHDRPDDGIGLIGRTLALMALGAVLMQGWRQLASTRERLRAGRDADATGDDLDTVPGWEGDDLATPAGTGRGLAGGTVAGRRAAAGGAEVDDGLQPFGPPPVGVVPTTH